MSLCTALQIYRDKLLRSWKSWKRNVWWLLQPRFRSPPNTRKLMKLMWTTKMSQELRSRARNERRSRRTNAELLPRWPRLSKETQRPSQPLLCQMSSKPATPDETYTPARYSELRKHFVSEKMATGMSGKMHRLSGTGATWNDNFYLVWICLSWRRGDLSPKIALLTHGHPRTANIKPQND